jgi:hypothetical protein
MPDPVPTTIDGTPPLPPPAESHTSGFSLHDAIEEQTEDKVDRIELIGEEEAAGFRAPGRSQVTPSMRYLHCSRTIHQLITDRNRAVGVYLAVASLTWTASGAILNAKPAGTLIVPIESIQRWCLPVTLGTLTLLALFTGFLLIRTRIGLIYEVAKMNVLLGLPVGRVKRVNPLSIFFIMHLMISLFGGASGAFFVYHLLRFRDPGGPDPAAASLIAGGSIAVLLVVLYVVTILQTTADRKLQSGAGG